VNVLERLTKKERKKREREMKTKETEERKQTPSSWEEMSKK
jgi:hypothetical protein